jgi:thiol-disulfide isomerase/thioredoxin
MKLLPVKNALLICLLLAGLPLRADDAATNATTPSAPAAASPANTAKARAMEINNALLSLAPGGYSPAAWHAVDAELDNYQKECGVTPQTTHNLVVLRSVQLMVAKASGYPGCYDALVQKLATDPQPSVAALVAKIVELKSKPIDLQFTAADGTPVDLAKLRGKVVLLDFWATWCGPCVGEVPNVVAAYQKYHGQGFEIVGISLDQDKDKMLAFTKEHGMVWPQYFDGKVWKNDISTSYSINSIPAMWLFDKKGMLVTTNGREDLDGQVGKLIAMP